MLDSQPTSGASAARDALDALHALPLAGDLFQALANELPLGVLVTDAGSERVLYANPEFGRLWKTEAPATVLRATHAMRQAAVDPERLVELWEQRYALSPERSALVSSLALQDGRRIRWRSRPFSDPHGNRLGTLHAFDELPPAAGEAAAGLGEDRLFRLTFEKAAVGMALISPELRLIRANPALCRVLGYDEAELRDLCLMDIIYPSGGRADGEWEASVASGRETFHLDRRFIRREGERVWVHLSVSVVRDSAGRLVYYVAMAEDVSGRKREEEERERRRRELEALATTDALTGLHNHRYMHEYLNQRLTEAQRSGQPVSVLMLDLDHFRALNENFGHDMGDRALRSVAESMRHALRGQDVACRYGGEEFVMILAGAPFSSALAAAERVRRRVEAGRPVAAGAPPVTCSIGVATYPEHASTAASLLKAADIALYQAKRGGRNRINGYEPVPFDCPPGHFEKLASGLHGAGMDAVKALVTAIDLRDRFTGAHCQRVTRIAVDLASRLECTEEETETLRIAASILDVGKIGLPDTLLAKPGRLSREEWSGMHQHPLWGEQIVRRSALPAEVAQIVRWHHERLDGSGYPDGLAGEQIPFLVRVIAVADVAAALRHDRPHRRAWPAGRVLEYLRRHAGATLDARVVETYCEMCSQP